MKLPLRARLFSYVFALLFGLLVTARADAQSIAIVNDQALPRLDRDGSPTLKRRITQTPEGINRRDCDDDQRIGLTMQISDFAANGGVEVWASLSGSDCKAQTSRAGRDQVCWRLSSGVPLAQVATVTLPVRSILSGALSPGAPAAPEATCGAVDLVKIGVHVLYFAPGQPATPAATDVVVLDADTVGPAAPTAVRAASAAGRVDVSWTHTDQVSPRVGTSVFCEPVAAPGTCAASNLREGAVVDAAFAASFQCGSVSGNTTTASAVNGPGGAPFEQGKTYAFAVAHTDAFDNIGPLSAVTCAEPGPPDDAGGCSAHGRMTSRGAGAGLLVVAAIGAFARKRKASLTRSSKQRECKERPEDRKI